MTDFFTFASSSSGNSYFINSENCGILIDCGISFRRITEGLLSENISTENIRGIILTHEHTDHINGLSVLLKHLNIPVYASPEVLKYLISNNIVTGKTILNPIDMNGELIGNMMVKPFKTSHDSVGSLGFAISLPNGKRISVCTDTGYITDSAKNCITGSNTVLIESNYDDMMLRMGPYPFGLKKRIASSVGHLSNIDCASFLPELVKNNTEHIILGHLSKENNIPELAVETSVSELSMAGMKRDKDYTIFAAPRATLSEKIVL